MAMCNNQDMARIMQLIRPNIRKLTPYSTARDEYKGNLGIFLDANENPFNNGYNRYPDPRQKELKQMLAVRKGVEVENIFVGNGSDEAIDLCFRIFCAPGRDNVIAIAPSYGMYHVSADINDVEVREVQLNDDFSLPVDTLLERADENSKLMFLCSPNNPSGNSFPKEQIERILNGFRGVVVVDEAYIDFSNHQSLLAILPQYPNLIVLQTLSKAYGMAALRLGLAFANSEILSVFAKVKYPYNINLAGMERAKQLLQRDVDAEVTIVKQERNRIIPILESLKSVRKVYPSDANFVLVKVNDARALYDALIAAQVIVRDRSHIKGCHDCLRITIGSPQENDKMLEIVRKYEEGNLY